ncbi:MAG: 4-hydroxy-3-methylbut-2-enyl diphosphate reductase [Bacteroidales bacterium]|nr:4-hydroxy-3-methylbut-2-enyl diphosphate reductase [Bacteroidales bacterium]
MNLSVHIDSKSGFCGGVIRAITKAEDFLSANGGTLYSLGSMVHNEAELARLEGKGLVTVGKEQLPSLEGADVIIRAHGEPPATYELAEKCGIKLIDCTCPVVLKLQKTIREAYARIRPQGGQVVIFGKVGHAEVLGLVGQVGGDAIVIENMEMLSKALEAGEINLEGPIEVFSQTTKSPSGYDRICEVLREKVKGEISVHNTICSQVASRHEQLLEFARDHDVIVFVAGKESSNGKVLFDLCRSVNDNAYHITAASEIDPSWFTDGDTVGVCGATSTPKWLLEAVAEKVSSL